MYKFLIFLVVSVMWSSIVFAQVNNDMSAKVLAANEAYWKTIDTTTDGGKWLVTVYKPYSDKMLEAILLSPPPPITDYNMSEQELIKHGHIGFKKCYEAMQNITPPDDLKEYHAKILKAHAAMAKDDFANAQEQSRYGAVIEKFDDEAQQELIRVFTKHGVPQNVMAEFNKSP